MFSKAASRKMVKAGEGPWKETWSYRSEVGVTEDSLSILGRFWAPEVLTTKDQKGFFFFFCPDKAFSVAEIRDALSSFISIATLWLPVWQTVGGDGRGGTVKTESAGVFQIRVTLEFSTHLSLTVIDCLLMTLKEFLEKQEGIASKMSHLSHPLQTQIFQMLYFWVTV